MRSAAVEMPSTMTFFANEGLVDIQRVDDPGLRIGNREKEASRALRQPT